MENIGSLALTGVGVCMPIIIVISAFAALVGYGAAPKASIYLGKKEEADWALAQRKTLDENIQKKCLTITASSAA